MAKTYNFHIYSPESSDESTLFHESKIRITNDLGENVTRELEEEFKNDEVAIANRIDPPGDKGAGGGWGVFPLLTMITVGLSIFVVVTKGFFDEIGRELGRRLIKALFDRKVSSELIIYKNSYEIQIIIPAKTSQEHLSTIEGFLDSVEAEGKFIYSPDSKTFIRIE